MRSTSHTMRTTRRARRSSARSSRAATSVASRTVEQVAKRIKRDVQLAGLLYVRKEYLRSIMPCEDRDPLRCRCKSLLDAKCHQSGA